MKYVARRASRCRPFNSQHVYSQSTQNRTGQSLTGSFSRCVGRGCVIRLLAELSAAGSSGWLRYSANLLKQAQHVEVVPALLHFVTLKDEHL